MNKVKMLDAFKKKAERLANHRKDPRFRKVMGFLKAKGLLDTNLHILATPSVRLDIEDVLWAGKYVEPRILEVLPAAILRFKKNWVGLDNAPPELLEVIECIRQNREFGHSFEGLEYKKMKFWANAPLKDKRTKPVQEKRRSKIFRLRPESLLKLETLVKSKRFSDQTEALEAAIEKL